VFKELPNDKDAGTYTLEGFMTILGMDMTDEEKEMLERMLSEKARRDGRGGTVVGGNVVQL
jgi:hypothetical protein